MNKLKVGVDLTFIKDEKISGVQKHSEEVINGLLNYKQLEIVLFVNENLESIYKDKYPELKVVPINFPFKNNRYIRGLCNRTITKTIRKRIIKKENCNFLIYPCAVMPSPIFRKGNQLITIHDVIPLELCNNRIKKIFMKFNYRKLMNKSKCIVTISNYSKKMLLATNPKYKGEIYVIPNIVEKLSKPTSKPLMNKKYIFSINSFFKYKNQLTLLKAFNLIKNKIDHNLVLVGRPEFGSPLSGYDDVIKYVDDNKLNKRVKIYEFVSDDERNNLFYNTDLFISPSTKEGFGRTPVEAAMCEVPVITTRETSLPEATLDMVNYYNNPTDEKELADKIMEVLNKKTTKNELKRISKELINNYSSDNLSKMYYDIIMNNSDRSQNEKK